MISVPRTTPRLRPKRISKGRRAEREGCRLLGGLAVLALCLSASNVGAQTVAQEGDPAPQGIEDATSPSTPAAAPAAPSTEGDASARGGEAATAPAPPTQAEGNVPSPPAPVQPPELDEAARQPAAAAPPTSPPADSPPESAPRQRGPVAPQRAPAPPPPPPPATAVAGPQAGERPQPSGPGSLQFMPGRFVERPLTAPRGTLILGLTSGSVFIDSEPEVSMAPVFTLGITSRLELGLSAPLRYDQGAELWTALEPMPHVAAIFVARETFELGGRMAVRIPTRDDTDPLVQLAIPALIRANEYLRLDLAVQGELGFEDKTELSLLFPAAATIQVTPWFFTGARAALDLGLTSNRTTGLDAGLLAGLTYHSQNQANVDLTLELFLENIGGGRLDRFSDGGGLLLAVRFFPELY